MTLALRNCLLGLALTLTALAFITCSRADTEAGVRSYSEAELSQRACERLKRDAVRYVESLGGGSYSGHRNRILAVTAWLAHCYGRDDR